MGLVARRPVLSSLSIRNVCLVKKWSLMFIVCVPRGTYRPRWISNTLMSEGDTPLILEA